MFRTHRHNAHTDVVSASTQVAWRRLTLDEWRQIHAWSQAHQPPWVPHMITLALVCAPSLRGRRGARGGLERDPRRAGAIQGQRDQARSAAHCCNRTGDRLIICNYCCSHLFPRNDNKICIDPNASNIGPHVSPTRLNSHKTSIVGGRSMCHGRSFDPVF